MLRALLPRLRAHASVPVSQFANSYHLSTSRPHAAGHRTYIPRYACMTSYAKLRGISEHSSANSSIDTITPARRSKPPIRCGRRAFSTPAVILYHHFTPFNVHHPTPSRKGHRRSPRAPARSPAPSHQSRAHAGKHPTDRDIIVDVTRMKRSRRPGAAYPTRRTIQLSMRTAIIL